MSENVFLTVKELSERWKCSIYSIYRSVDKVDFIPCYRLCGGGILFKIKDIEEYEKQKVQKKYKKRKKDVDI
ncbi:MAG: hypothetical protein J1F17_01665 [Oscillospiraceae bacterium]|nr:hypothetical protein [Oscillospiraceae bacterium]